MAALILILLAMQAGPVGGDGISSVVREMRACMDREVHQLEPSGESADIVADAARTICEPERDAIANRAAGRGSTPEGGARIAERVLAELDEQIMRRAVLQVTQIRADRHRQ